MKQILFIAGLIAFAQISCKKSLQDETTAASFNGKWRMIMVKDNNSGSTLTKPRSTKGEVDIIFKSINETEGIFFGKTPSNTIWENNFKIGANQSISVPCLSMTKVGETPWGDEFVENFTSSVQYNFEKSKLNIKTAKKTLTFKKL